MSNYFKYYFLLLSNIHIGCYNFHRKDVEACLDWEMNVQHLFASHQVSEEKKVSLATLSFQQNVMYCWTSLEREIRLTNSP